MKTTTGMGGDDEGEEEFLPFGRESENQSTRRETSDKAYRESDLDGQRAELLALIRERPMTCDEILALGWEHQSASAGMNWLMRHGFIVATGEKRLTRMGRAAIVWRYEPNPVPIVDDRPTRRELVAEVERLRAERDEARRSLCQCFASGARDANLGEWFDDDGRHILARDAARERGWDCFEKER